MRITKVDIDHKGIVEMSHDPRLADVCMPAAEACRDTAIVTAPVRKSQVTRSPGPGHYKRSMFAAKLMRGIGAFYGSDDTKAMLMEYGSQNNRAFHTLRNAARAHRLRMVDFPWSKR